MWVGLAIVTAVALFGSALFMAWNGYRMLTEAERSGEFGAPIEAVFGAFLCLLAISAAWAAFMLFMLLRGVQ